jgi:hypothetical protein
VGLTPAIAITKGGISVMTLFSNLRALARAFVFSSRAALRSLSRAASLQISSFSSPTFSSAF